MGIRDLDMNLTDEKLEQRVKELEKELAERRHTEETFRENASILENILEKAADGICICHNIPEEPYVRFTHWNPRMTAITGYTMGEINKLGWYQTMYPDLEVQKWAIERMARMRAGNDILAEEWVITTKDGKKKSLSISTSIVKEEDGKVHVLAVMQDVTERKRADTELRKAYVQLKAADEQMRAGYDSLVESERSLRESEQRYRNVFENHAAVKLLIDPDNGSIIEANKAAVNYYGWSYERLKQMKIQEINTLPPEDVKKEMENARTEKRIHFEFRHRRADGSIRDVEVFSSKIEVKGKDLLHSIIHDITERKHVESRLMESEERYRTAIEHSNDGVALIQGGRHIYVNQKFLEIFGYDTTEEVIGKTHSIRVHPDDLEMVVERNRARERGEPVPSRYEFKGIRKDGTPIYIEISATRVNFQGESVTLAYFRDITDRKQAEAMLRESERKYRSILENIAEGYYEIDLAGNLTFFNDSVCRMIGYPREELMGMNNRQYMDQENAKNFYKIFNNVYKTGKPTEESSLEIIRKDGTKRFVGASVSLIMDSKGQPMGFRGIVRDITESKQTEEALRIEKERFQTLSEEAPFGMVLIDQDGTFKYINSKFRELFGYELTDVPDGKTWRRKAHPDPSYRHRIIGTWLQDLEEFKPGERRSKVFTVTCKDGTERIINFISVQLTTGENLMVCEDITERKRWEEALQQAETKYRSIFENVVEGIYQATPEGRYLTVNPPLARIYGYSSPEEFLETITDIGRQVYLNPDDRLELLRILHEKGIITGFEVQLKRKDGSAFWASVNARFVYDENGKILCYEGTVENITDRKQAEDALRESEERYRRITEGLTDYLYTVRIRDGRVVETRHSEACEVVTGYTVEEFAADPYLWIRMVVAEERDQVIERVQKILAGEAIQPIEHRIVRKDGQIRWVSDTTIQQFDPQMRLISYDGVIKDITDRKQAEEAFRQSEARYRTLVEESFDGIFIQKGLDIVFANQRLYKMLGYLDGELEGQEHWIVYHPDYRPLTRERAQARLRGEEVPLQYEVKLQCKDGTSFDGEIRARAILFGKEPGIQVWIRDITERKRVEEEKRRLEERLQRAEKMEALGTLAGGVAHDLNNVLGIIVGYAELLLMEADKSSSIRPSLVNIMNGGQRAAAIVQDLLTLARRGISGREVLNLNKIIADCQQSPEFEKLSSYHSSVKIKTDLEPDLLNISGSSVHLVKTLYNLISNASEAMTKGGILTIKTANQYLDKPIQGYDEVREGDYVVLSVADAGEGIPAADLKRIFEPFYTKKVMGRSGTGLGLAVVWGTVKDHHGYINVQSEEGKGSTFTLYFPVTREDISAEAVSISISEYLGKGESILVVDDVKGQRDLAAMMLRKLNYSVTSVSSGEEAIAYVKEHRIDLMVLDMIMDPGMDGLDTYRSILEIYPRQKAIIVSGFSESDRVHATQALGAGAYVKKPYITEKLGLAVRKELDRAT